ncbi:MAG: UDP-glucuronic acid decarboxylase family protein [Parvularcula sp.]|jgi:UDP-glucuronate decarboxylase|nr:UDP-glucuronic acid decarboxylase family protein [Parvularcula sp.]
MTRIVVTGGAGFLGSHLCEALLKRGDEVICVDNFFTGRKTNVAHLRDFTLFEIIRHDITFPLYVECDAILNFACPASPKAYQQDPVQTTKVCVHGSINMLGLAKRVGATILQASTSEVYGDPQVHPQAESYVGSVSFTGPRSCYDEGKRCAETLFHDYRRQHGIDTKIVRIFNTYGPRMQPDDGRVVSNFICQALANDDITIFGDGSQTRSFCYVDDLVEGILAMLAQPADVAGPINLGNPAETTIREIAEQVIELTGSTARVVFRDLPEDDPKRRQPDISKARSLLDFDPQTELRAGLKKTIAYFEKRSAGEIPV